MNFSISLFIIFVIKATSTDLTTYTLTKGDSFTCYCELSTKPSLEWILQKVNGEEISLVRECYMPYTSCDIRYDPANFTLVTEARYAFMQDSSLPKFFESRLTVKHVEKDMRRVFCTNDNVLYGRDRCWMNVVDYVPPDNSTSKSPTTNSTRLPSTTQSSFFNNVELIICYTFVSFGGVIGIPILLSFCYIRLRNCKALQGQNEAMGAISNTPQLTPELVTEPDQNDLSSTRVNPLVHPINSPLTTESHQHTASIQSTAPNDSPPPYSSLLELRVEPPQYSTLTAECYNCNSVPSQQAQNVPPPYTTRYTATYNSVSPSALQQAQNVPPPYTTTYTATYNSVSLSAQQQAPNEPPPYTTTYSATYNSVSISAQQPATTEPPPPYSVWHTS